MTVQVSDSRAKGAEAVSSEGQKFSHKSNFRTPYYESLGVSVVEVVQVENSFHDLLYVDAQVNLTHLVKLTVEFGLPEKFRRLAWLIGVGVFPVYRAIWPFVLHERHESFQDIRTACQSFRVFEEDDLVAIYQIYRLELLAETTNQQLIDDDLFLQGVANAIRKAFSQEQQQQQQLESQYASMFWCLVAFIDLIEQSMDKQVDGGVSSRVGEEVEEEEEEEEGSQSCSRLMDGKNSRRITVLQPSDFYAIGVPEIEKIIFRIINLEL